MASSNTSPTKKDVKSVELKWYCRSNRNKSPKTSPRKYNLRSKRNQNPSPKKQPPAIDSKQKKISSFFAASPKQKINNNDIVPETPVKTKSAELTSDDLYLSPSARLDSLMPKVEDILRARENEEHFKKIHAIITESSKRFLEGLDKCAEQTDHPPLTPTRSSKTVTFKDCRHLTVSQLTKKFKKDAKFIDDMFHGRIPSERYDLFKKDTPLNNGTRKDLRVNDTNIAFTQDQLIHIISLFRERYDHGNMYKYSDFYFKVLLPEYCLKIFSDLYKMTPADALEYLKSVPVRDD